MIQDASPIATLRIPGPWTNLKAVARQLPEDFELAGATMSGPHADAYEIQIREPDAFLADFFRRSLRRGDTRRDEFRKIVDSRHVLRVTGRGGTVANARRLMLAGAALLSAGGRGVCVENSGRVMGAASWLKLVHERDDAETVGDGILEYVRIDQGPVFSQGMHVFGRRDTIVAASEATDATVRSLRDFTEQTVFQNQTWSPGEQFIDAEDRSYLVQETRHFVPEDVLGPGHPWFNPHGHWRLVPQG